MNTRTKGILAIVAAFFVLFSAMLDPCISIIVAIAALVALSIYKLKPAR